MHRRQFLQLLDRYKTPYIEEAAMVERTRRFVIQHADCFDRNLAYGHVTVSAWVVNPARSHVLMLHHRKLDIWLQPGGHADGETDIVSVALKETSEESGIDIERIKLLSTEIFDVDVHTIYASEYDSRHQHFDPRFLVEIDDRIPLPGSNEAYDVRWVALGQVLRFNNARSLYRLVQKTRHLVKLQ